MTYDKRTDLFTTLILSFFLNLEVKEENIGTEPIGSSIANNEIRDWKNTIIDSAIMIGTCLY